MICDKLLLMSQGTIHFKSGVRFILLLFLLSFSMASAAGRKSKSNANHYIYAADSLIKIELYEEALNYYFIAYDNGMPKDSLYFLWADLFIKQEYLDSALAVNGSALNFTTEYFRKELLKQRYSILILLGAFEQAVKISAELGEASDVRKTIVIPSVKAGLALKLEPEVIKVPEPSYWTNDSRDDYIHNEIYTSMRVSGNLHFIPVKKKIMNLSIGSLFQMNKSSAANGLSKGAAFDSLGIEAGWHVTAESIADRLNLEFKSVFNHNRYKNNTWIHSVTCSYIEDKSNIMAFGGYILGLEDGKKFDYQYGFISAMLDIKKWLSSSLNLSFYGSEQEPVETEFAFKQIYFDADAVISNKVPLFYKDKELKNPLDTNGMNGKTIDRLFKYYGYLDSIKKNSVSTDYVVVLDLPVSYLSIEPSISFNIPLKRKWKLKPSIELGMDIYTGNYRWHEFDYFDFYYLAVDYSNNSYYEINGIETVEPDKFGIGKKIGFTYRSQKRIDTSIEGTISLGHSFKKAGNIIFSIQGEKLWSNLLPSCPMEIRNWLVSFTTSWQY